MGNVDTYDLYIILMAALKIISDHPIILAIKLVIVLVGAVLFFVLRKKFNDWIARQYRKLEEKKDQADRDFVKENADRQSEKASKDSKSIDDFLSGGQ